MSLRQRRCSIWICVRDSLCLVEHLHPWNLRSAPVPIPVHADNPPPASQADGSHPSLPRDAGRSPQLQALPPACSPPELIFPPLTPIPSKTPAPPNADPDL